MLWVTDRRVDTDLPALRHHRICVLDVIVRFTSLMWAGGGEEEGLLLLPPIAPAPSLLGH